MNTTDMIVQMSYAAGQIAMPQIQAANLRTDTDSSKEFKTLLNERKVEAGQESTVKQKNPEQKESAERTESVYSQQKATAVYLYETEQGVPLNGGEIPFFAEPALFSNRQTSNMAVEGLVAVDLAEGQSGELFTQVPIMANETVNYGQSTVLVPDTEVGSKAEAHIFENTLAKVDPEVQMQENQSTQSDSSMQPKSKETVSWAGVSEIPSQPLFRMMETMPVKVGEAYTLDTEQADFDVKLTETVTSALDRGVQKLEIRLAPDNLGNVVVELNRTQEGLLHVVLHADTDKAVKLLSEHSSALGLVLQNNGQGEVRVEVTQPKQENQQWQQPDQNDNQNQRDQSQDRQQERRQQNDDFLQRFRLGLFQGELYAI